MATIIFIYLHIFSVLRHLSSQREKQQICHFFSINEGTKLCGTIKVKITKFVYCAKKHCTKISRHLAKRN
jgi:hypothetical protein